jgi:hypothetical protein
MEQCEYLDLTLNMESSHWRDSDGREGDLVERAGYWSLAPLLNELGAHGWERAGIIGHSGGWEVPTHRLLFKRRRDQAAPMQSPA